MTWVRCALSRKVEIPREYLERVYVGEGKSTYVIAKVYGCSVPTVVSRLREYGIAIQWNSLKKGRPFRNTGSFTKGHVPWSKGRTFSAPRKNPTPRGDKHWNWKGGSGARNDIRVKNWRNGVFRRDNYTCQECGRRGGKLNAHHLKKWSEFPGLRYDIDNGQTLCEACHRKTDNWGNRKKCLEREEIGMVP